MTSWNVVKNNKQIDYIQDPFLNYELDKKEFEFHYDEILATLNCKKDYNGKVLQKTTMDNYFDVSPLRNNVLIFKDDDKKIEFYEIGMKLKVVTDLRKIHEGTQNEIDYSCKKVTFQESTSSSERSSFSSMGK